MLSRFAGQSWMAGSETDRERESEGAGLVGAESECICSETLVRFD